MQNCDCRTTPIPQLPPPSSPSLTKRREKNRRQRCRSRARGRFHHQGNCTAAATPPPSSALPPGDRGTISPQNGARPPAAPATRPPCTKPWPHEFFNHSRTDSLILSSVIPLFNKSHESTHKYIYFLLHFYSNVFSNFTAPSKSLPLSMWPIPGCALQYL